MRVDEFAKALAPAVRINPHEVEWHGNYVGARWKEESAPNCSACVGFKISHVDLFDGHVAKFLVEEAIPHSNPSPVVPSCEAMRVAIAKEPEIDASSCACRVATFPDGLSRLPTAPDPCTPAEVSSFSFTITRGALTADGRVVVRQNETIAAIQVRGASYEKLLKEIHKKAVKP